jgi:hypothetical protein
MPEPANKRFSFHRQPLEELAGKFDFVVADGGLIVARCWSARMASRIARLLEEESRKHGGSHD